MKYELLVAQAIAAAGGLEDLDCAVDDLFKVGVATTEDVAVCPAFVSAQW